MFSRSGSVWDILHGYSLYHQKYVYFYEKYILPGFFRNFFVSNFSILVVPLSNYNNIKPWQREEGGLSSSGHMNLNSRPTSANQPTPLGAHGWKSRCNHSFFAVGRGPPSAGACIMPVVFPAEENPCVHQDFAEPFQTVMCELTLGAPGHPL